MANTLSYSTVKSPIPSSGKKSQTNHYGQNAKDKNYESKMRNLLALLSEKFAQMTNEACSGTKPPGGGLLIYSAHQ